MYQAFVHEKGGVLALFPLAISVISLSLTVATLVGPIFFSLPRFVNINISGTALFSMALGPLAGGLWAISFNFISSTIGMGSGIIGYLMASRAIEAVIIGWVARSGRSWRSPLACAALLTAVQKPISLTLAYFFGAFTPSSGYWSFLMGEMDRYLSDQIATSFLSYTFSCFLAYLILKGFGFYSKEKEVL